MQYCETMQETMQERTLPRKDEVSNSEPVPDAVIEEPVEAACNSRMHVRNH